jgi:hypothetical protein
MIRCKKRETTSRFFRRRERRGWEESLRVRLEEEGSLSVAGGGAGTTDALVSSTLINPIATSVVDIATSFSAGVGAGGAQGSPSVAALIACTMAFASLTFCFSARLTVFSVYPFGSKTPSRM